MTNQDNPVGSLKELAQNGLETIKIAMKFDRDIAWDWHLHIATTFIYEGARHYQANKASAKIMQLRFGIDVTKFQQWDEFEKYWKEVGR